ncbi:MAG TPA: ABC transporter permease [Amycolatopsis sp.]|nr:ABC transporter permease [Amycolatopsis sp.]
MTVTPEVGTGAAEGRVGPARRALRFLLADRVALLCVLLVVMLVWLRVLSAGGYLTANYDAAYLASTMDQFVPLGLLGLAQFAVMVSGRGGIDLSVGAMVSLTGMAFGFMVGDGGWPLWVSLIAAVACGAVLGAVNGFLVAYLRFPALIATLATYYGYSSLALLTNSHAPISTPPVQNLIALTQPVDLPGNIGIPLQVFTFLLPCAVLMWLLVNRGTYGRKLYAIGTNEIAARFATIDVASVRFRAYLISGVLSGVTAVVTVAQFASARPDAGTTGNGMALPSITIAALGGVAIAGGVGRVGGVLVAALLVVWLNAGILLAFEGNAGSQYQLAALGILLVVSALLNEFMVRGRPRRRRRPR